MIETESIGRRIADYRKLRGWSQRELARRVGYSFSAVEKIERGLRGVERYSTINAFARALGVDPSELTGEPRRTRRQQEHATVPLIRRALTSLPFGVDDGPIRPLPDLRREVEAAISAREAGKYARFGEHLPALLEDLQRATLAAPASSPSDREQLNALLAEALHSGSSLLRRLGYIDLAWIAVQQARPAAEQSHDALLPIANDWHVIELFFRTGDTARALQLTNQDITFLDNYLATDESPQALSLIGTMHLLRAMAAAQDVDESDVRDALDEAARTATRVGSDRDDYQSQFGPVNTQIFGVSTAVEMGQGAIALQRTRQVNVDGIPSRERQARYLIDVARAYSQVGKDAAALQVISDAHKRAPEYVINQPMAREVVTALLERERRTVTPGLRTIAKKMGVA